MRRISIIVPVFNEAENLARLHEALLGATGSNALGYEFEFIYINDGSTDRSGEILSALASADPRVKYLEFSRNFGKEVALSAGVHHADSDAAIMLDADLQHPPTYLREFLRKWEEGADTVIGVRSERHDGALKRLGAALFYRIMNLIGSTKITPHATDFRLIDRTVISEFNRFTERDRITRGLLDWMGFRRAFVEFAAPPREGSPRYGTGKLFGLAFSAFVAHSLFPLKLAGYAGVLITLVSGALGLAVLVEQVILDDPLGWHWSGSAMLAVFNSFLIGIVLSSLGLIALYIAHIHNEVVNRPMYVIRRRVNL